MVRAQDSKQSEARKWCFGKQDLIEEKSLGKGEGGLDPVSAGSQVTVILSTPLLTHRMREVDQEIGKSLLSSVRGL